MEALIVLKALLAPLVASDIALAQLGFRTRVRRDCGYNINNIGFQRENERLLRATPMALFFRSGTFAQSARRCTSRA